MPEPALNVYKGFDKVSNQLTGEKGTGMMSKKGGETIISTELNRFVDEKAPMKCLETLHLRILRNCGRDGYETEIQMELTSDSDLFFHFMCEICNPPTRDQFVKRKYCKVDQKL